MKISSLLAVSACLLNSCATNTGDAAADKRGRITNAVAKELWNGVVSYGSQYALGALSGKQGQSTASAAFDAAGVVFSSGAFERVLASRTDPGLAAKAGELYAQAAPKTAEEHSYVANVIGSGLQYLANQNFRK